MTCRPFPSTTDPGGTCPTKCSSSLPASGATAHPKTSSPSSSRRPVRSSRPVTARRKRTSTRPSRQRKRPFARGRAPLLPSAPRCWPAGLKLLTGRTDEIARRREPQRGQVDQAGQRVRRARHDRQRRLLRRDRPQSRGQGFGRVLGRPHVEHPARTHRRRRLDSPVELPAADGGVEDPSGDRRRQHDRAQARRAHAAARRCCSPRRPPRRAFPAG